MSTNDAPESTVSTVSNDTLLDEADEVIRELLDVITGWIGNPELRRDPRQYDTTRANDFLRKLNARCPECGGLGWIHVPEHGCGGDERLCAEMCPEPVQVRCPSCRQPEHTTPLIEEPF